MTEAVTIQLIVSITGITIALITLIKVRKVSKDINGHMTKYLALKKEEGKEEQRAEDAK